MKTKKTKVLRWELGSAPIEKRDYLAAEEPLEIRVDNHRVSVTMRTPGNDDELAVGFLLSEGLIHRRADVAKIAPHPRNKDKNVTNVFLGIDVALKLEEVTRRVFVSSSCGLCGKESIESVHQHFAPLSKKISVDAKILLTLPEKLRASQETFDQTGGLHAAAIFDLKGKLIILREDVGRHNAVDKVLGHCFLNGIFPLTDHVLMVSGRASFEILQKALSAKVPVICAVSAPSSLAVEFARESKQTLVGFLRGERMNIYSMPGQIRF
ncbi:MAG: formate dehydrogenase family accessory protein FdhD [Verrucomicrobiales bacterium]|nr:formate dehydrogenase family accessory protein FdhD [Verrucomicrobiales bacterium]